MIADKLENAGLYFGAHPYFEKAFTTIAEWCKNPPEQNRVDLDGDKLFGIVQKYVTKPACEKKYEGHRKYIDIQFVFSGHEIMGWEHVSKTPEGTEYSDEKDCVLCDIQGTDLKMGPGYFAVFYPNDLHKPGVSDGEDVDVVKFLFKVAVE